MRRFKNAVLAAAAILSVVLGFSLPGLSSDIWDHSSEHETERYETGEVTFRAKEKNSSRLGEVLRMMPRQYLNIPLKQGVAHTAEEAVDLAEEFLLLLEEQGMFRLDRERYPYCRIEPFLAVEGDSSGRTGNDTDISLAAAAAAGQGEEKIQTADPNAAAVLWQYCLWDEAGNCSVEVLLDDASGKAVSFFFPAEEGMIYESGRENGRDWADFCAAYYGMEYKNVVKKQERDRSRYIIQMEDESGELLLSCDWIWPGWFSFNR